MSTADSVVTKINYNGSMVPSPVKPIKLLQFLMMELKMKLKDYVSEGDKLQNEIISINLFQIFFFIESFCADDDEIAKVFKEINYAIKHVKMECQIFNGVST